MVGVSLLKPLLIGNKFMPKAKSKKVDAKQVMALVETMGNQLAIDLVYDVTKIVGGDNPLKSLIQAGNLKLPKTTAIFNMSSATECASLKLGLCKAVIELKKAMAKSGKLERKNVCYAVKSERPYRPGVKPYRDRQGEYWLSVSAEDFVFQFMRINGTKKVKYDKIRLNEAGDFHSQECVDKAERIAKLLKQFVGVTVYCYTSRDDLDFSKVKHLVVNRSLNLLEEYKPVKGLKNEFLMIPKEMGKDPKQWPKGYAKCPADCNICDRCSIPGKKSFIIQH